MTQPAESYYIQRCMDLLEQKLGWGERAQWRNYDFERLSAAIYADTAVTLSVTTLKRLSGKVTYNSLPTLHTLNTLARFAGFADWRIYQQWQEAADKEQSAQAGGRQYAEEGEKEQNRETTGNTMGTKTVDSGAEVPVGSGSVVRKKPPVRWWLLLLAPVCLLGINLLRSAEHAGPADRPGQAGKAGTAGPSGQMEKSREGPGDTAGYRFSCTRIEKEGVPNSVVFHYEAPGTGRADSLFIAQSWDLRRKAAVPKGGREFSSIYYYPGFFRARLIADTTVVRTQDLLIPSKGWVAMAETEPAPVYFRPEEFIKPGRLEVGKEVLDRYHLPLYPQAPVIGFYYTCDMGALRDDHFRFETTLKTVFHEGAGACQRVKVLIQCKNDAIIIPLAARACVGDLGLYAAGTYVSSRQADLSGFGCDLRQWTSLRVEAENKELHFFINGRSAYSLRFPHEPAEIVGVQFQFQGMGAIRATRFVSGDGVVSQLTR